MATRLWQRARLPIQFLLNTATPYGSSFTELSRPLSNTLVICPGRDTVATSFPKLIRIHTVFGSPFFPFRLRTYRSTPLGRAIDGGRIPLLSTIHFAAVSIVFSSSHAPIYVMLPFPTDFVIAAGCPSSHPLLLP